MRLSKQQRANQGAVLAFYKLAGEFQPSILLLNELACALVNERAKPIFRIVVDRMRRERKLTARTVNECLEGEDK